MRAHERQVAAVAAEANLEVRRARRGGHWHLVDADGRLVAIVSSTPRCRDDALRLLRQDIRRRLEQGDPS